VLFLHVHVLEVCRQAVVDVRICNVKKTHSHVGKVEQIVVLQLCIILVVLALFCYEFLDLFDLIFVEVIGEVILHHSEVKLTVPAKPTKLVYLDILVLKVQASSYIRKFLHQISFHILKPRNV